jgi:hypothetical protein
LNPGRKKALPSGNIMQCTAVAVGKKKMWEEKKRQSKQIETNRTLKCRFCWPGQYTRITLAGEMGVE